MGKNQQTNSIRKNKFLSSYYNITNDSGYTKEQEEQKEQLHGNLRYRKARGEKLWKICNALGLDPLIFNDFIIKLEGITTSSIADCDPNFIDLIVKQIHDYKRATVDKCSIDGCDCFWTRIESKNNARLCDMHWYNDHVFSPIKCSAIPCQKIGKTF